MIYLNTFLYYSLFASVVLLYGIGLNKTVEIGITKFTSLVFYLKAILSIFSSSILSWLMTYYILVPLNMVELAPLVILLIFICVSIFVEALVRLTTGTSAPEFVVSFLIVLLSVMESTSIVFTMIICVSCFVALLLIVPFCISFKKRVCSNGQFLDERYYSLFFIYLAVLILILSVWDVNWFNKGVVL